MPQPPILFVHGNGDSSALWLTTVWRFESNGYPRELLHALDLPSPSARDDDDVAQANRSGTAEQRAFLAAEVEGFRWVRREAVMALGLTRYPWLRDLAATPQDPHYHAEGDVLTHTRLVAEAPRKRRD